MKNPVDLLQKAFGFDAFRPIQQRVIERLCAGEDAFVLMPTGGGKSLCYQIPAMARPGVGLVVSPLISLMKDQVDALRLNGVKAACFNSSLSAQESESVLTQLHAGSLDLLYVSPERLLSPSFLQRLDTIDIALLAIDEAHCISQWGHDFRPEYAQLGQIRHQFDGVPLIALTATADEQTRCDIQRQLKLESVTPDIAGFDRPNIRYTVETKQNPFEQLMRFLDPRPQEAGIIYAMSRKKVERLADRLAAKGINAAAYHAGLPTARRQQVQEAFLNDDTQVVVATVAFGMGIDKSNVRFVVHYDLPRSIEGYYQETGRAGRDGLDAEALLLYGPGDIIKAKTLIERGHNADQVRVERHKLNAMAAFAEAPSCRRRVLLGYFGQPLEKDCGNCDACLNPPEQFDATEEAQKALSCVYRVGQNFGIGHVIDVLRGAQNQRITKLRHDQLSTYGIGADLTKEAWSNLLRQLIHHGYLKQDIAAYSVLKLTEKARPLLRGESKLTLAKPRIRPTKKPKKTVGQTADHPLFERLRTVRKQLADDEGVPPFVIFSDATLIAMAAEKPLCNEELLRISGVGRYKLERYGAAFLAVLNQECAQSALHDSTLPETLQKTLRLARQGVSLREVAEQRGLTTSTITGHLERLHQRGEPLELTTLISPERIAVIEAVLPQQTSGVSLTEIKAACPEEITYDEIRLVRRWHSA